MSILSPLSIDNTTGFYDPDTVFGLYIFPEGYTDQKDFERDIDFLRESLSKIYPFNLNGFGNLRHKILLIPNKEGMDFTNAIKIRDQSNAQNPPNTKFKFIYDVDDQKLSCDHEEVIDYVYDICSVRFTSDLIVPLKDRHPGNLANFLGLPVILIPSVENNIEVPQDQKLRLELENRAAGGMGVRYIATSVDSKGLFARLIARTIAFCLGLMDEFEREGQAYEAPTDLDRVLITNSPNLVYFENRPDSGWTDISINRKWERFVTTNESLKVESHIEIGSLPNNQIFPGQKFRDIGFYEGGGGFRSHVYRAAPDCLMRRQIENPDLPVKGNNISNQYEGDDVEFCPVCQHFLERYFKGEDHIGKYPINTIATQQLKYDEISWKQTEGLAIGSTSFQAHPNQKNDEYWSFVCDYDPTNYGLKFSDCRVKNQTKGQMIVEQVFEEIKFIDLGVKFKGDSDFTGIDLSEWNVILSEQAYSVKESFEARDAHAQRGFKIIFEKYYLGKVKIELALSCVFRGPYPDFEPPGAAVALKIFPQLSFSWSKQSTAENVDENEVEEFKGTIRYLVNTHHHPMHHGSVQNRSSFFTDSNSTYITNGPFANSFDGRKFRALNFWSKLGSEWASLFDYYYPDIVKKKKIVGVWGPMKDSNGLYDTRYQHYRNKTIPYPDANFEFKVRKKPRQGFYDNIHTHGHMGFHGEPNANKIKVAAPFCATDCFHLHWRWSLLAAQGATSPLGYASPRQFMGWQSSELDFEDNKSNWEPGAPLIPPNQHLEVEVEDIDLVNHGTKKLDYIARVINPIINYNNVFGEHGGAWAAKPTSLATELLHAAYANLDDLLFVMSVFPDDQERIELFDELYDRIRFFDDGDEPYKTTAQVPEGTYDHVNNEHKSDILSDGSEDPNYAQIQSLEKL